MEENTKSSPQADASEKPGSSTSAPKRKKKPGLIERATERFLEAVRDAAAVQTFTTPQDTAPADVQESDDLTDEQEAAARRDWAMGALEYREAQLKKFNGRTETMEQVVQQMHRGAAELALEIEQGTAWFLNDGDPHRFEEEPVTPDTEVLELALGVADGRVEDATQGVTVTKNQIEGTRAAIAALDLQIRKERGRLRSHMTKLKMSQQEADKLRVDLRNARGDSDAGPEDQVDPPA